MTQRILWANWFLNIRCISRNEFFRTAIPTVFMLVLCQCNSLDMSEIDVGQNNTVSWADAKTIIQKGKVDYVYQSHAGAVGIIMLDDTRYETKQPNIDDVIAWVKTFGKESSIGIMAE